MRRHWLIVGHGWLLDFKQRGSLCTHLLRRLSSLNCWVIILVSVLMERVPVKNHIEFLSAVILLVIFWHSAARGTHGWRVHFLERHFSVYKHWCSWSRLVQHLHWRCLSQILLLVLVDWLHGRDDDPTLTTDWILRVQHRLLRCNGRCGSRCALNNLVPELVVQVLQLRQNHLTQVSGQISLRVIHLRDLTKEQLSVLSIAVT